MHSWQAAPPRQFSERDIVIRQRYKSTLPSTTKPVRQVPPYEAVGLDLAELETFIAVAELGSFSLAAQRLHLTQPSVTGRVQRLESALGIALLVRTTRKVETTAAGAALQEEATQALAGLRTIVSGFRSQARQNRHRVVLATTPMLAALTLPPILRDYSRRYTDVQVVLLDLRYPEALEALDAGSADLAVLSYEGYDSRYIALPLASQKMVLVAPAGHPLAQFKTVKVEQLAPHALLVIKQYAPVHQRIAEALVQRGLSLCPSMPVENLNTALGMLDAEMGATLLPMSMARRSRNSTHAIIEIEDLELIRHYAVVRSSRSEPGTATVSCIEFLRKAMG